MRRTLSRAAAVVGLILGFGLLWTVLAQMFRYATESFFANVGSKFSCEICARIWIRTGRIF
jgi:hypothetical protein